MLKLVFARSLRVTLIGMIGFSGVSAAGGEDVAQAVFERVFGEAARLDPAVVAKVKSLPPGERLWIDRDGDGRSDEAWFIDTDPRHTEATRPLLVHLVDEDGDLDLVGPDLDSDLYLADWKADGTIDSIVDYEDHDGDDDLDAMGIYYWSQGSWGVPTTRFPRKPGTLMCRYYSDIDDTNLAVWDVDYTFWQPHCQYRRYMAGNRSRGFFGLEWGADAWIPLYENPFNFYDPDGDGAAEVTIRFDSHADDVWTLRYSFDADGDAYGRRVWDYDFSITAQARGARPALHISPAKDQQRNVSPVRLNDEVSFTMQLRGMPVKRSLCWDKAQEFGRQASWAKVCLTWDEMNANTEGNVTRDPHERWEGIIMPGSAKIGQVGGPACSRLNKRFELSLQPVPPLQLYYDPTDHRLHLVGASEGWIDVDYDLDGKSDARYTYLDQNRDGIFDRRQIDLDADGQAEFDWQMKGKDVRRFPLEYQSLSKFYRRELADVLEASQQFIDAAKAALEDRPSQRDPVETFFLTKLESWQPITQLGWRMRSTPGGARYYVDFLRDRMLDRLKQAFGQHTGWRQVEEAFAEGKYAAATELVLAKLVPETKVAPPERFRSFVRRIPVRIDNTEGIQRDHWPVVLGVRALRTVADDFNPDNCAVVGPDRWVDWLEIPHQVDKIDVLAGEELSFLVDMLPADRAVTYYVYYSPTGTREKAFARKTGAVNNSPNANNIGWESTRAAYRSYDGKLDFFGKHTYRRSQRVEWLVYPIKDSNYHNELPWGIDALLVGKTSGLGGLTLYVGDRFYPVQNRVGETNVKFARRALSSGAIRAAVEITANNVLPNKPDLAVRILCIAYAERQESEVRVALSSSRQAVDFAPGLTRLAREKTFLDESLGCFGAWGYQVDAVGEVGLGLIVPTDKLKDVEELAEERRLRCDSPDGTLRYWIIGDWRRGRRFPVGPTYENWRHELQALASLLQHDVQVTLGSRQELP